MATAKELLAGLNESEESRVLIIDNDLRTINVPSAIKALGVEADGDVHRLQFQMPRMYGDTDLSTFNIRINYMNANNEGDIYVVTDKKILTSSITFSWLVGPHALAYKGNVRFIVCLKESDSTGTVLREFNTTVATLPVLEGLEVDAAPLEGELTDVLEQLLSLTVAKVAEVEAAGTAQIAKVQEESTKQQVNLVEKGKEVLATIPEDYQTTTKLANEGVRTKADAIICSAEGDLISVADSSDDHIRGLKLFGKTEQITTTGAQLAYFADGIRQGASGVNARVENGIVTLYGAITDSTVTYPISVFSEPVDLSLLSVGDILYATACKVEYTKAGETKYGNIVTFTDDITYMRAYVQRSQSEYVNGEIVYPMLAKTQDAPFEYYSGGVATPSPSSPQDLTSITEPTFSVYGNNLFPITEITAYNVTAIPLSDGSISYKGTSDGNAWHVYQDCPLPITGRYSLTVHVSKPTNKGFLVQLINRDRTIVKSWIDVGSDHVAVFDGESGGTLRWNIGIESGEVVDANVKLMVNIGETSLPWEPYADRQTLEVNRMLPGIPVTSGGNYTDANGQQWICDEIDFERSVYVKRVSAEVFDGSDDENWYLQYASTNPILEISPAYNKKSIDGLCTHYIATKIVSAGTTIGYSTTGSGTTLRFRPDDFATITLDEWKNRLSASPIISSYVLAEPIETPLTADELAAFQALKTNYPNTTVLNDAGAWMHLRYNADTEAWITNLIDEKIAAAVTKL